MRNSSWPWTTVVLACVIAGCSDRGDEEPTQTLAVPRIVSLGGVEFHIADRYAVVFPASLAAGADGAAQIPQLASFSLCVSLPALELQASAAALRSCRDLHARASDFAVFGIEGQGLTLSPPAPDRRPAETHGLAPQLQYATALDGAFATGDRANKQRFEYTQGPDYYGLHAHYPQKEIDPSTKSYFWRGADVDHVTTLIDCSE